MLQDSNKGKKPQVNKSDIENVVVQTTTAAAGQVASKSNGKVQKAAKTVSEASAYAGVSQKAIDALFQNDGRSYDNAGQPQNSGDIATGEPDIQQASTATAIAASKIFGVNHLVALTIFVEGEEEIKSYKHFRLAQKTTGHHNFTLVLDHDVLGVPENHEMEKAQNMLGKRIAITFAYRNIPYGKSPERHFVGVITNVGFSREHGNRGNIVLKGNSPTILLDGAPHIQSFGGKQVISLLSIANTLFDEGLGGKYEFRVDPEFTNNVSYSCQYDETHYNYLARTAAAFGEQFYYDGKKLHFGKLPPAEEPIKLVFGEDVSAIDIQMRTRHVNRELYGYNSSTDKRLSTGQTKIEHTSSLAKAAYSTSEQTFKTPSLRMAPLKAGSNHDVEAAQKSATGREAVNVFVTSGSTSVPFLYPGCVVQMYMRRPDSKEVDYMTKLMVTDIHHSVDALGNYTGSFEAIAADTGYLPAPVFHTPIAEPQVATVTDNKDSQGRVQVRFDWQDGGKTSEWIRVMSPDAGGSDKVSKNRGFMAIPEVGDQVMIGFVYNHPDRPYVMGGLFHGKVGGGGGTGNNIKSLSSKSGHTVELNDAGGITIKDKTGGNSVVIDGTNKVTVTSSQTVELTNGKSSITLEGTKITIYANEIEISGDGGPSAKIEVKGINTDVHATANLNLKSDLVANIEAIVLNEKATATANVEAPIVNVNGSATANIKGGIVNIN